MTGGLYVISECIHPQTKEGFWVRTDAVDGVMAIRLCVRLNERHIYSRIVPVCARYGKLPIANNWKRKAIDWLKEPVREVYHREYLNYAAVS